MTRLAVMLLMTLWVPTVAFTQTESEQQGQVTVTYESFGVDFDGDGTVDFFETTTNVYDANDNLVSTSTQHCDNGVGNGADCRPGMATFDNDDLAGQGPGNPGARLHDDTVTY